MNQDMEDWLEQYRTFELKFLLILKDNYLEYSFFNILRSD